MVLQTTTSPTIRRRSEWGATVLHPPPRGGIIRAAQRSQARMTVAADCFCNSLQLGHYNGLVLLEAEEKREGTGHASYRVCAKQHRQPGPERRKAAKLDGSGGKRRVSHLELTRLGAAQRSHAQRGRGSADHSFAPLRLGVAQRSLLDEAFILCSICGLPRSGAKQPSSTRGLYPAITAAYLGAAQGSRAREGYAGTQHESKDQLSD